MPLRGESVGTAYVRILADGSDLDDSIRKQLGKTEPALKGEGKKGAEAYSEGFEEEMKKAPTRERMREGIQHSLAKGDAIEKFLDSPKWKETERSLVNRFGEVGKRMGANLANDLIESGDFDKFNARFDNLIGDITRATEDITKVEKEADKAREQQLDATLKRQKKAIDEMGREISAGIKERSKADTQALRNLIKETDVLLNNTRLDMKSTRTLIQEAQDAVKQFDQIDRERAQEQKQSEIEQKKRLHDLGAEFDLLTDKVAHYNQGIGASRSNRKQYLNELRDLRDRMHEASDETRKFDLHADDVHRTLRRSNPTLDRFSGSMDKLGDRVGRSFGKGSRNDLINFFGVFVGKLASLPGLITRTVSGFINFGKKVAGAFIDAGGGITGLVKSFGTLLGPIALAGAAVVGFTLILGPLAAALSLTAGFVTALAATLGFALVGAIGAVAGLLTPLGIGFGVLAAAILSSRKQFGNIFADMTDDLKELGKVAAEPILDSLKEAAKGLAPLIDSLKPLVKGVAEEIAVMIDGFGEAIKGKGLQGFIDVLERKIPGMVRKLGKVFGNTFKGFGGLFLALLPLANRFLNWLVDLTDRFAEFTTSKEGQQELKEFFRKAGNSAETLWGFIKEASKALGTLLGQGKGTGDNIFETLTAKATVFRDFIQEQIDNGNLQKWFRDAKGFGDDLGGALESIILLIEELDTEETRAELEKLVETFDKLVGFMEGVAIAGGLIFDALDSLSGISSIGKIEKGMEDLEKAAKIVKTAYKDMKKDLDKVWEGMKSGAVKVYNYVKDKLATAAGVVKEQWNTQIERIKEIWGKLVEKLGDIKRKLGEKWDEIVAAVKGVPDRIAELKDKFFNSGSKLAEGLLNGIKNFATGAGGVVAAIGTAAWDVIKGRINAAISAMNSAIPNSIGPIDVPDNPISPLARGHITSGPMLALIGENGREAVVPLDRPLSQVDPAVRELAAFARGLPTQGAARGGRTVDASGWTIVTPTTDSRAVANEILNRLVAVAG